MLLSGTSIPAFKILSQKAWLKEDVNKIRPDNLQIYVQNLVKTLKINEVSSLNKLIECTKKDKNFLKK